MPAAAMPAAAMTASVLSEFFARNGNRMFFLECRGHGVVPGRAPNRGVRRWRTFGFPQGTTLSVMTRLGARPVTCQNVTTTKKFVKVSQKRRKFREV
jgi:hypothetical protein